MIIRPGFDHPVQLLGRRGALALLGLGLPASAWATTTPTVTQPTTAPLLPAPAAPQPPAPPKPVASTIVNGIDSSKIYFVFFNQAIDTGTMRTLRRQLVTLVEAGVEEINLVIESPGGAVEPALMTYSFIRSLPARINTHGQGLVASAANILYLAGDKRTADRNARFFFHPTQGTESGTVTAEQLREREADFAAVDGMVVDIYRDRTSLPPDEIARFGRAQVFYTAEQARGFGVVQTVADLAIPGNQAARILFLD